MAKEKLTEAGGIWLYGKLGTESEWICAERKNLIYKTPAASYGVLNLNVIVFNQVVDLNQQRQSQSIYFV